MGAVAATRARVRADIVRIVHRDLDLPDIVRAVGQTLQRAVPFDGVCLLTVDPATLLPTGEVVENGLPPSARMRLTEIELGEADFNKFTALARDAIPAASLSAATGGALDRSRRQREIRRPSGFADELRSVLTGSTGSWGSLTLLREVRRPYFSAADVQFVASLSETLADGVRRAALHGTVDDGATETGFLVLAADDTIEMSNEAATAWNDELWITGSAPASLPVAIRAVVAQTRRVASGDHTGLATARVRTRRGRWAVVRGIAGRHRSGRRPHRGGPAGRAGIGHCRSARLHRTRANGHGAGCTRPANQGDLQPAAPVYLHRAGPPQGDLREVGVEFARGELVAKLFFARG